MSIVETHGKDYAACNGGQTKINTDDDVKLTTEFEDLLSKIIRNHSFITYSIERKVISNQGGNYLGILYEVNVKGKTIKGNSELNFFVKTIIPGDKMTIISVQGVYVREMYAYNELSKVYEDLQNDFNVPPNERYQFVKCYGVITKQGSEALILENMCTKGYTTCDRMKPMPLKFAQLSIIQLAKFHALSYALEKYNYNYFESTIKGMKTPFWFNDDWNSFVKRISRNTINIYESTAVKGRIEQFVETMPDKWASYFERGDRAVLCHGDYRANNILMKEEDGKIINVVPVDYQLLNMGCPINDLIYFIFGASDQTFRKKHLNDLKNLYRETMSRFLKYFDMDLEMLYPTKIFEKDYKDRLDYGLMVGINFLPIILAPEDDIPDFGETNMSEMNVEVGEVFKERIKGLVDDFLQWGYI